MMTLTLLHSNKSKEQIPNIMRFFPIRTQSGKEFLYYETPNHQHGYGVKLSCDNISSYELTCPIKGADIPL